ncbi:alpha/beta fold hydrolase [Actinomadura rubrisoli]|uniref:Alpha/beta fold hydrolase n=1 Tax=Actinomadura rubrisoli TaxID=2530368 RepID=A0A4R5C0E7_9ACTN|nr:alpha/beta fold hydrolase [Actinomadura rubrisoli]TDD93038.1 alpha/beta fold hydrolase [Actinomadura rubrisoli]
MTEQTTFTSIAPAHPRPRVRRRVGGRALLAAAVLLGPPAGVVAFLLAAALRAAVAPSAVIGVAAMVLVTGALALPGGRLAFRRRGRLAAALVTGATAVLATLAMAVTFFRPLDIPAAALPAQNTRYWQLSTGSRIAYTLTPAHGRARPAPVVRLHGGPGTPGSGPDDLDRELAADGFDVYTYDQLGSGRSQRLKDPTGYTVARQIADLEAIRRRIGAERLVLVGSSWGATLAAQYLAAHPGGVARMVLVSPGALWAPEWEKSGEGELWDRLTPVQRREMDGLENRPRLIAWSLLMAVDPRAAHDLVPDEEIDPLFNRLLSTVGSAATCYPERPLHEASSRSGFYSNQLTSDDALKVPDPRPALRGTATPALVLRGECDYKKPELAREYRDTLPGAKLVQVRGAGHVIEAEQPAFYRAAVTAFLTGRPLPPSP